MKAFLAFLAVTALALPVGAVPISEVQGVWITGFGSGGSTYLAQWNGSAFDASTPPGSPWRLNDVQACALNDAWVVGVKIVGPNFVPYAAKWDGSAWTENAPPGATTSGAGGGELFGLHVAACDAVWVVEADCGVHLYNGIGWTNWGDASATNDCRSIFQTNDAVWVGGNSNLYVDNSLSGSFTATDFGPDGARGVWGQDLTVIAPEANTPSEIKECVDLNCTTIDNGEPTQSKTDVWGIDVTTGPYWVASDAFLRFWDGSSWSNTQCQSFSNPFQSTWGTLDSIWLAGNNGRVCYWDGTTLTSVTSGTSLNLQGVGGINKEVVVEEPTALPEFEAGLVAFASGLGFVTSESQLFFVLILIGLAVIAGAALLQLVSSGRFKNNFLLGTAILIGIVTGLIFDIPLWMTLLAVVLGAFTVQGAREAANTYRAIQSSIQASRAARAAAAAEPAPPTESPLAPAAPAQETPEPAPAAPETPEEASAPASDEEASS